jgi:ABC-type multidrug transport system fused ATPase/permease subunit
MTDKVIRAKVLFFDSNPSGRIISRFAKDIGIIDNVMPILMVFVTLGVFRAISVVITIATVNPYLIIPSIIGLLYMFYVVNTGMKSMLES